MRTLTYKDTKMLVPAVSLYPRFTVAIPVIRVPVSADMGCNVGLGRVVRKVRQHPDDHEFESQQWQ
jgi:hypothetical protein